MMKTVKTIAVVILTALIVLIYVDFVRFPEMYMPTAREQLKIDIYMGDEDAISLYESEYFENDKDLFDDDFEIRNTYCERCK